MTYLVTDLNDLSDQELLQTRICDLPISLETSPLSHLVQQFQNELSAAGLSMQPKLYLGDEWFSPEGVVAIAIPFYLAHPRLVRLERSLMFEVEGEDDEYFLKLLRHEAGHCFEHAYRVSKRQKWQETFGSSAVAYHPETYRPRPHSRGYVKNLKNWYAQAHPDEDFAETFAVWLDPASQWQSTYERWPRALRKLTYVNELVKDSRKSKGRTYQGEYLISNSAKLKSTLGHYYQRKKREHAEDYPDLYDPDLKRIFKAPERGDGRLPGGAVFLARHKKILQDNIHLWTGERMYVIERLLRKLRTRSQELDLRVHYEEAQTLVMVSTYLCTLVNNYLFTGKFRRKV